MRRVVRSRSRGCVAGRGAQQRPAFERRDRRGDGAVLAPSRATNRESRPFHGFSSPPGLIAIGGLNIRQRNCSSIAPTAAENGPTHQTVFHVIFLDRQNRRAWFFFFRRDFLIQPISFSGRSAETLKVGASVGRSMDERRNRDEPRWRQTRPIRMSDDRPHVDWRGDAECSRPVRVRTRPADSFDDLRD